MILRIKYIRNSKLSFYLSPTKCETQNVRYLEEILCYLLLSPFFYAYHHQEVCNMDHMINWEIS